MTAGISLEYEQAVSAMGERHITALEGLGIAPEVASGLVADDPPIGFARIRTSASGFYEPSEDGEAFYLSPCVDGGAVIDIVAWRPSDPAQWWLRTGNGVLLNPNEPARVAMAQDWGADDLLLVSETPLSWLQARCRGVVVLDWGRCIPFYLSTVTRAECETAELGKRLRAAYAANGCPRIFYREVVKNAA